MKHSLNCFSEAKQFSNHLISSPYTLTSFCSEQSASSRAPLTFRPISEPIDSMKRLI